jgi:putative protease
VVIFSPEGEEYELCLDHIYDEDLNEIEAANHPKQIIKIKTDINFPKNSMMRVKF